MVLVGQKSNWYVEDSPWKEGGNSYIYLARKDPKANEVFALKLFKSEIRRDNQRNRFLQEIEILKKLVGVVGCVQYVDDGLSGNTPFIVTILYEGGNFYESYLKQTNPDDPAKVLSKFLEMLHIVERLHSATPRLAVRDIKPQNIFLTKDKSPILGDFGLSLFSDCPEDERLTVVSQIGSQGYRPPEWTSLYLPADHTPGDIWSLGRVLWAIFARRNPPITFDKLYGENHLKQFIEPRNANVIQGLVNFCLESAPEKRPDINSLIVETTNALNILKSVPAQSASESLTQYLAELNMLGKGSSLRHIGLKKQEDRAVKEEELETAREVFAEEFRRLHRMIEPGIDKEVGTVTLINQSGSSEFGFNYDGTIQVGIMFSPSHDLVVGGASHVQFTAQFGVDRSGELYYIESSSSSKPVISNMIHPSAFLNFANKKVASFEKVIFEWFLPTIKSQLEK